MTTDPARLAALIARIEKADAAYELGVMRDVFIALHKSEVITDGVYDCAVKWLNVGASLDAAVSLVPAGWAWSVSAHNGRAFAATASDNETLPVNEGHAATPALALTAAALRAREASE